MKRAAGISVIFFLLFSIRAEGQITGAVITSANNNVGTALSAGYSGTPESGNHVDYEWFYTSPSTSLGTSSTYTLLSADQAKSIYLKAYEKDGTNTLIRTFSSSSIVVNSYPVAQYVGISGTPKVGLTLTGTYIYSDADAGDTQSGSSFAWFRGSDPGGTGNVAIGGATAITYTLTSADLGSYIGFSVTPRSGTGSNPGSESTSAVWTGPVLANAAPSATIQAITGTLNVNDVLTGHYSYSDPEGDVESGSVYRWLICSTLAGTYDTIAGATSISHQIQMSEQRMYFKFYVKPKAATGTRTGSPVYNAVGYGPANSKPYATALSVSGTVAISSVLTATYTFNDDDGSAEGTSTFRWFRDGAVIAGATSSTYTITTDDEASKLKFEVTPVSATGYPNIGDPVTSAETIAVPSSGTLPVASQVCIEGINTTGNVIKGKYVFTYSPSEDHSVYRWMRDNDTISGETTKNYILTSADVDHDIYFVVIPYSKGPAHKKGISVKSAALARIMLAADSYSVADPAVTLNANVSGGVFSGHGVSSGIFSPSSAGTAGSPHTIKYNLSIVNTSTTCSQESSAQISVVPVASYFSSFRNFYCHNGGPDTIYVENVPVTATGLTFKLTNPKGKVALLNPKAIIIDPGLMRPGNKVDTLFFTYVDGGSTFPISKPLVIDSVGTNVSLANLDAAYCEGGGKRYVTAENTYPGGGSGIWTGTLMTDLGGTSAFVDPSLGAAGNTYPITYQYVSPYGCKSNIVPKSVVINPLPNSAFSLDATYNIEGGEKDLVPIISGGTFIGSGVVGTKFYPSIAGVGTIQIKYYVTDANSCSSNTAKNTIVRRAQGTINVLPSMICYRDTTFHINVSGLPSGVTVSGFSNSKMSISYSAGSLVADYSVKTAHAGYDTVKFAYTWDGVGYKLTKPVYIDSIGKVAISGLKDNYCDYEGTASLRVFVENSTGSGNFSFNGPAAAFTNYGNLADFDPSKTPASAIPYSISYTHVSNVNNSGCRKTVSSPVTVNKAPTVTILTARTSVNYDDLPILLDGSPSDGIFSGRGIYKVDTKYYFNPQISGLGKVGINFSYIDSKSCYSAVKDTLVVSQAQGNIIGIAPNFQYCYDGIVDTLSYAPGSGYSWFVTRDSLGFRGRGITKLSKVKASFNPALAGKGNHTIQFRYIDSDSTLFTISEVLNVDSLGKVSISNLHDNQAFCDNIAPFEIYTTQSPGIFTGPVTGTKLDASKASGDTSVVFTYTNSKTGCFIRTRVPIQINPAPVVNFVPNDNCIESSIDSTKFINNTTPASSISKYYWTFFVGGSSSMDSIHAEPKYMYRKAGGYLVKLEAKTFKGCSSTYETSIDLGEMPTADFTWGNECYHVNPDSLYFTDKAVSATAIVSRVWRFDFAGNVTTSARTNPGFLKTDSGYVHVRYTVNTGYAGCFNTINRDVYIMPSKVIVSTLPYVEQFEGGKGGWVRDYNGTNDWAFGKPARTIINTAYSGTKAWYTNYIVTKQDPAYNSIVSPCFDFTDTTIKRPMIRMMLWKRFDRDRNGASLQYRIGDSPTWEYVGTIDDDGINWFNSALIGRLGGDLVGWTTKQTPETKWSEAKHKLDFLKGQKDVKFRVVYGSDGSSKDNEGMAFDDIWIGERTRNVLFEQFGNSSNTANKDADILADSIMAHTGMDVINIRYHTNFPGADAYNAESASDVSSRVLYYGLTKAPYAFVDGGFNLTDKYAGLYDFYLATPDTNALSRRSLVNPLFKISLRPELAGGILIVKGSVKAIGPVTAENMTLYIAVTEKVNSDYTGSNGVSTFYNVFRKLLPDGGGIDLRKVWTGSAGDSVSIPVQSWIIQKIKTSHDIEVIAFLQNNITKEVYQATSQVRMGISTGIENNFASSSNSFSLYPNPSVNKFTIEFSEPLVSDSHIRIYDIQGLLVADYKGLPGINEYKVEDSGLKPGIYLVKLIEGGKQLGFKKLIITGR